MKDRFYSAFFRRLRSWLDRRLTASPGLPSSPRSLLRSETERVFGWGRLSHEFEIRGFRARARRGQMASGSPEINLGPYREIINCVVYASARSASPEASNGGAEFFSFSRR